MPPSETFKKIIRGCRQLMGGWFEKGGFQVAGLDG